jgi:hypothetical protein
MNASSNPGGQQPAAPLFDDVSRRYHEEMIKLHDRVVTTSGQSPKKDGRALPVIALIISIISLGVAVFNANFNRLTLKGKILSTIDELSKLTPPPPPGTVKPSAQAPAATALSSDSNEYWFKIDDLVTNINLTTEGSISARSYVSLLNTTLAFGDSKHTRLFLQKAESANDKDEESKIQLALDWAQLAASTKNSDDVTTAIAHIEQAPKLIEPKSVISFQTHYDLAEMYLLKNPLPDKVTVGSEVAQAKQALAAVDDPTTADRLKTQESDLESRVEKRFAPPPAAATPKKALDATTPHRT